MQYAWLCLSNPKGYREAEGRADCRLFRNMIIIGGVEMARIKNASEEKTKGLIADRLKNIDEYPTAQDITVNGITWFKEDSYKGTT